MKKNLTERAKNGRNGVQLVYVLDCIKNSTRAFDEEREFETDADALQFFFDCFDQEFNFAYNKHHFPSLSKRVGEGLRGLPSCCNVDYQNYDIIQLGIRWGVLKNENDKKAETFLLNFFDVLGARIVCAANKVGLDLFKYM